VVPPHRLYAPDSDNVRKLYWAYFGLDPMPKWWFYFTATAREIGIEGGERFSFNDPSHREERTRSGADAARWLDALVQLRHATAHQDPKPFNKRPELGVATPGRGGQWGLTRYNAQNAIAVVTQLALCVPAPYGNCPRSAHTPQARHTAARPRTAATLAPSSPAGPGSALGGPVSSRAVRGSRRRRSRRRAPREGTCRPPGGGRRSSCRPAGRRLARRAPRSPGDR
jgi:hypothetical protein